MARRGGGGTQYEEIIPGVGAPMVAGPGAPVREDVQAAAAPWVGLSNFAEGGLKYIDGLQRAADLNTVAQKRAEYGKRVGEALATFSNSVDGSSPMEDMKRWGEVHERIKAETLQNVTGAPTKALGAYFQEHEEAFNGKVRESVYKAVEKRSGLTMDASLADKVALGMQTTNNREREQYVLDQYRLVDAQVAAGLLSPIDAEVRKVKDRQQYYSDVFRGDLLKPDWKKAYDEWQQDKPIDSMGNTWKRLVGKDGIAALERMTQTIFAERTREAVRLAEKRENDGIRDLNARLASEGAKISRTATDAEWEAYKRRVEDNPYATPELIRSVQTRPDVLDSTPASKAAKAEVDAVFSGQKDYDGTLERRKQEARQELRQAV